MNGAYICMYVCMYVRRLAVLLDDHALPNVGCAAGAAVAEVEADALVVTMVDGRRAGGRLAPSRRRTHGRRRRRWMGGLVRLVRGDGWRGTRNRVRVPAP